MYSTEMIKDFENKFNSAALVELLKEPINMLVIPEIFESWRLIDEYLTAEKEAYNAQYLIRKEQLTVTIPVITTASDTNGSWLKLLLLGLGCVAAGGYVLYQFTPSAAAKRAEGKTRKAAAVAKRELVEAKSRHDLMMEKKRFEKASRDFENKETRKEENKKPNDRVDPRSYTRNSQMASNVIRLVIEKGD